MFVLLAAALSGCGTRRATDLLEARLRLQEDRLAQLESELAEAQISLDAGRRENEALYARLASSGEQVVLPEQAEPLVRATGIRINEWMTGGLDRDGVPGDDLLSAVVVPHDARGNLVKLPGTVEIELRDLSKSADRQSLGAWTFESRESRTHWHDGALASGYLFELPWQSVPESSEIVLHARLTTADGRRFGATATVRITPPEAPERLVNEQEPTPSAGRN